VNLAGGLHHAMPGAASGFCVYNDLAISIQWLLDHGVDRVAYIDVDVHHGDGVQAAFWNEPRVLTVSVHESGRALFPGTGFPMEVGGPDAVGSAVNVALPPGTGDEGWLRAFHGVVPGVVEAFRPDVIVTQQGCDTHADDPLAHLMLTVDGQRLTYLALHDMVHTISGGRWIATGGGGYSWIDVVPRAWSHLMGVMVGAPVPPETPVPEAWRSFVTERLKVPTPGLMTDGAQPRVKLWEQGYDPADPIDAAVLRTRDAVYPWHGLTADPYHGF
jgi:acetoin utilization protein AcuC